MYLNNNLTALIPVCYEETRSGLPASLSQQLKGIKISYENTTNLRYTCITNTGTPNIQIIKYFNWNLRQIKE